MNRLIQTFVLFLCCIGCQEEFQTTGYLNCHIDKKSDLQIAVSKSATIDTLTFSIFNRAGELVDYFGNIEDIPSKIRLEPGRYMLIAESKDTTYQADRLYFRGEQEVIIQPEKITSTTITCTASNSKVTTYFKPSIVTDFPFYQVIVADQERTDTLGVNTDTTRFIPSSEKIVTLLLQNKKEEFFRVKIDSLLMKAQHHYRYILGIEDADEDHSGGASFVVTIDKGMNEYVDTMFIPVVPMPKPSFTFVGFDTTGVAHIKEGDHLNAQVKAQVPSGVKEIELSSNASYWLDHLPRVLLVSKASPTQLNKLNKLGIIIPTTWMSDKEFTIDYSPMTSLLTCDNIDSQLYEFHLVVRDSAYQVVESELIFDVAASVKISPQPVNAWAHSAYLTAQSNRITAHPGFEYRAVGTQEWLQADSVDVVVDGLTFTTRIDSLIHNTAYEYRAFIGKHQTDSIQFQTEEIIEIPNLNFDIWTLGNKNWYANDNASNSYWASGNEGVTMSLVNKPSNTTPTDDAVRGKAAFMKSIAVPITDIAAGNLYIGDFDLNIGNPAASAKFGRPYSGARPTSMKGFYKYKSSPITVGKAPNGETNDLCHIFIEFQDSAKRRIGYGEFYSAENKTDYTEFHIDIEYTDKVAKPAFITIVATSSKYGAEFIGGLESELYIDEFTLQYE